MLFTCRANSSNTCNKGTPSIKWMYKNKARAAFIAPNPYSWLVYGIRGALVFILNGQLIPLMRPQCIQSVQVLQVTLQAAGSI